MPQTTILESYLSVIWLDEYVSSLVEDILEERISIRKIKEKSDFLRKESEKILKEHNISVSTLHTKGKLIGKKLVKQFEQNKTPKETAKVFSKLINSVVLSVIGPALSKIKKIGKYAKDQKLLMKVAITIMALAVLTVVQGAMVIPLTMSLGHVGSIVSAIIVAPFTEEAMKTYFIASGMAWSGTGIFVGVEAIHYIIRMTAAGFTLPAAIGIRAVAAVIHFTTTLVQKYLIDRGEIKKVSLNKKRSINNKSLFVGWIAGVSIHMAWNSIAVLTSEAF